MLKLEARTHFILAKNLYEYFEKRKLKLSKFWLIIGSLKPDFISDDINHYKDKSISIFYKKYNKLTKTSPEKKIKEFARELGELFHYIADFFCFAHNDQKMKNNYSLHFKYEWQLNKFAYKTDKAYKIKINPADLEILKFTLPEIIEYRHKNYLQRKQNFKKDLSSSFKTSILLTNKLLREISSKNKKREYILPEAK